MKDYTIRFMAEIFHEEILSIKSGKTGLVSLMGTLSGLWDASKSGHKPIINVIREYKILPLGLSDEEITSLITSTNIKQMYEEFSNWILCREFVGVDKHNEINQSLLEDKLDTLLFNDYIPSVDELEVVMSR